MRTPFEHITTDLDLQNAIGYVASLGEEVKNTFNFSVPFLSWLAIVILVAVALILYFISLR